MNVAAIKIKYWNLFFIIRRKRAKNRETTQLDEVNNQSTYLKTRKRV